MADLYYPFPPEQVIEWPGTRPAGWAPHWGTDWPVPEGTAVPATSNGTIVYVGDDGLGGRTVDLMRDDGLLQRFGHLSKYEVVYGQRVIAGETIALSGNTGASTGPHLHWELRRDRAWQAGAWVNPRTLSPSTFGAAKPVAPSRIPTNQEVPAMANPIGMYIGGTKPARPEDEVCVIYDIDSGFYTMFSGVSQAYINNMAKAYRTGSFGRITAKHWNEQKPRLDEIRKG